MGEYLFSRGRGLFSREMFRKGRRIVWGLEWFRVECRLSGFGGKEIKFVLGVVFYGLGVFGVI